MFDDRNFQIDVVSACRKGSEAQRTLGNLRKFLGNPNEFEGSHAHSKARQGRAEQSRSEQSRIAQGGEVQSRAAVVDERARCVCGRCRVCTPTSYFYLLGW